MLHNPTLEQNQPSEGTPVAHQAATLPPALEVENLNLFYAEKQALFDISMQIPQHQVTAFIGASGCGKSSLLRCFNRMNDTIGHCRTTGKVIFEGNNIYDAGFDVVAHRGKIGMVFQKPNPFPKSIFDNVAYGPKIQGIAQHREELEAIVQESLVFAGLWAEVKDRLGSSALSLSGGQQQRLCIARAMAVRPKVILMDEPCSALDPIATAIIEELIAKLSEHYTVVIVTHSMQQAARVSEQTAFFHLGQLVEFNLTSKIFHKPDQQQTENYITGRFG